MKPVPLHPEAAQHLLWFNRPDALAHWTMPFLELVTLASAALALAHALRAWRQQRDSVPLAVWFAAFCYGVVLEIIVYNTVDNFWHGEFSVMLYHNRLPLYIMALYPAVLYYTWGLAGGFGMSATRPWRQCLLAALACAGAGQALYAGFDNLGPQLNWWAWDTTHPTLQPFWASVPFTSYLWMWTLCFSFPLLVRLLIANGPDAGRRGAGAQAARALLAAMLLVVAVVAVQTPLTLVSVVLGYPRASGFIGAGLMALAAWACLAAPRDAGVLAHQPTAGPMLWCLFLGGLFAWDLPTFLALGSGSAKAGHLLLGLGGLLLAWQLYVRLPMRARQAQARGSTDGTAAAGDTVA
jgi:hypothetical protein